MKQSRAGSAVEALANLAVGYVISVALTFWIFGVTPQRAAGVSLVFTIASVARSYGLRRMFARWN